MTSTQKHHGKVILEDITPHVHTVLKNLSQTALEAPQGIRLSELVKVMRSVKIDTAEARANETSMSDNNGKRIKYRRGKSHHR